MSFLDKLAEHPYIALACSIVLETTGTTCMKASDGFTVQPYGIICVVGMALSLAGLVIALKKLPLGLTYGIWGGVGTALTTIIGIVVWGDPFGPMVLIGIVLVIAGIVLLNMGENKQEKPQQP